MSALAQLGRGEAPGSLAVGDSTAQKRCPVIDLDGRIGFGGAVEGNGLIIGDAVTHNPAVARKRTDLGGRRTGRINRHLQRARSYTPVTGHVRGLRGKAVGTVGERRGIEAPSSICISDGAAEQLCPVVDVDPRIGFSRATQCQSVVISDVVARYPAVVRN